MNEYLLTRYRYSPIRRTILYPVLWMRRKIMLFDYHMSKDFKFICTLKDSCKGERCFIIGNGPSLVKEDLELLKNEKTFAFNRIHNIYPYTNWRPTYYMVTDGVIIDIMTLEKKKEIGAKYIFASSKKLVWKYKDQNAHLIAFKSTPVRRPEKFCLKELSEDVSQYFMSVGTSVVINAFELAGYMGFKEIYLLGVDHNFAVEVDMDGHKHINKSVMPHFKESKGQQPFRSNKEALTEAYKVCKEYADRHGIKVVNVTRGGKLEVFERDTLEHVLQR